MDYMKPSTRKRLLSASSRSAIVENPQLHSLEGNNDSRQDSNDFIDSSPSVALHANNLQRGALQARPSGTTNVTIPAAAAAAVGRRRRQRLDISTLLPAKSHEDRWAAAAQAAAESKPLDNNRELQLQAQRQKIAELMRVSQERHLAEQQDQRAKKQRARSFAVEEETDSSIENIESGEETSKSVVSSEKTASRSSRAHNEIEEEHAESAATTANPPVDSDLYQPTSADDADMTARIDHDGSSHEGNWSDKSWNEDKNDTVPALNIGQSESEQSGTSQTSSWSWHSGNDRNSPEDQIYQPIGSPNHRHLTDESSLVIEWDDGRVAVSNGPQTNKKCELDWDSTHLVDTLDPPDIDHAMVSVVEGADEDLDSEWNSDSSDMEEFLNAQDINHVVARVERMEYEDPDSEWNSEQGSELKSVDVPVARAEDVNTDTEVKSAGSHTQDVSTAEALSHVVHALDQEVDNDPYSKGNIEDPLFDKVLNAEGIDDAFEEIAQEMGEDSKLAWSSQSYHMDEAVHVTDIHRMVEGVTDAADEDSDYEWRSESSHSKEAMNAPDINYLLESEDEGTDENTDSEWRSIDSRRHEAVNALTLIEINGIDEGACIDDDACDAGGEDANSEWNSESSHTNELVNVSDMKSAAEGSVELPGVAWNSESSRNMKVLNARGSNHIDEGVCEESGEDVDSELNKESFGNEEVMNAPNINLVDASVQEPVGEVPDSYSNRESTHMDGTLYTPGYEQVVSPLDDRADSDFEWDAPDVDHVIESVAEGVDEDPYSEWSSESTRMVVLLNASDVDVEDVASDGNHDSERNRQSFQKTDDSNASKVDHSVQSVTAAGDKNFDYEGVSESAELWSVSERRGSSESRSTGQLEILSICCDEHANAEMECETHVRPEEIPIIGFQISSSRTETGEFTLEEDNNAVSSGVAIGLSCGNGDLDLHTRSAPSVDGSREFKRPTQVGFRKGNVAIERCDADDQVAHQRASSVQFQSSAFTQSHGPATDAHPGQSSNEGKMDVHNPACVDEDSLASSLISDMLDPEIVVSGDSAPPVELRTWHIAPTGLQTCESPQVHQSTGNPRDPIQKSVEEQSPESVKVMQPISNDEVYPQAYIEVLPFFGSRHDMALRRKSLEEGKRQVEALTKIQTDRRTLRNADLTTRSMLLRFDSQPREVIPRDGELAECLAQARKCRESELSRQRKSVALLMSHQDMHLRSVASDLRSRSDVIAEMARETNFATTDQNHYGNAFGDLLIKMKIVRRHKLELQRRDLDVLLHEQTGRRFGAVNGPLFQTIEYRAFVGEPEGNCSGEDLLLAQRVDVVVGDGDPEDLSQAQYHDDSDDVQSFSEPSSASDALQSWKESREGAPSDVPLQALGSEHIFSVPLNASILKLLDKKTQILEPFRSQFGSQSSSTSNSEVDLKVQSELDDVSRSSLSEEGSSSGRSSDDRSCSSAGLQRKASSMMDNPQHESDGRSFGGELPSDDSRRWSSVSSRFRAISDYSHDTPDSDALHEVASSPSSAFESRAVSAQGYSSSQSRGGMRGAALELHSTRSGELSLATSSERSSYRSSSPSSRSSSRSHIRYTATDYQGPRRYLNLSDSNFVRTPDEGNAHEQVDFSQESQCISSRDSGVLGRYENDNERTFSTFRSWNEKIADVVEDRPTRRLKRGVGLEVDDPSVATWPTCVSLPRAGDSPPRLAHRDSDDVTLNTWANSDDGTRQHAVMSRHPESDQVPSRAYELMMSLSTLNTWTTDDEKQNRLLELHNGDERGNEDSTTVGTWKTGADDVEHHAPRFCDKTHHSQVDDCPSANDGKEIKYDGFDQRSEQRWKERNRLSLSQHIQCGRPNSIHYPENRFPRENMNSVPTLSAQYQMSTLDDMDIDEGTFATLKTEAKPSLPTHLESHSPESESSEDDEGTFASWGSETNERVIAREDGRNPPCVKSVLGGSEESEICRKRDADNSTVNTWTSEYSCAPQNQYRQSGLSGSAERRHKENNSTQSAWRNEGLSVHGHSLSHRLSSLDSKQGALKGQSSERKDGEEVRSCEEDLWENDGHESQDLSLAEHKETVRTLLGEISGVFEGDALGISSSSDSFDSTEGVDFDDTESKGDDGNMWVSDDDDSEDESLMNHLETVKNVLGDTEVPTDTFLLEASSDSEPFESSEDVDFDDDTTNGSWETEGGRSSWPELGEHQDSTSTLHADGQLSEVKARRSASSSSDVGGLDTPHNIEKETNCCASGDASKRLEIAAQASQGKYHSSTHVSEFHGIRIDDAPAKVAHAVDHCDSSKELSSRSSWRSGASLKMSTVDGLATSGREVEAQESEVEERGTREDAPFISHDSTFINTLSDGHDVEDSHESPTPFFPGSRRRCGNDGDSMGEREDAHSSFRSDVHSWIEEDAPDADRGDMARSSVISHGTASSYHSWSSRGVSPSLRYVDAGLDVEDAVEDGENSRESSSHPSWRSGESSKKSDVDGSAVPGHEVEELESQVEGRGSRQDAPFMAHDSARAIDTLSDGHVMDDSHASPMWSFAGSTRWSGGDDVSFGEREAVHSSFRSDGKSWVEEDAPDGGRGDLAHSGLASHDTASSDRSWSSRGVPPHLFNVVAALDVEDAVKDGDSSRQSSSHPSWQSGESSKKSVADRPTVSECEFEAQESEVVRKDGHEDTPVQSHDSTRRDSSILRRGFDDLHTSPTSFFAGSERLSGGDDARIGEREEEKSSVRSDVVSLVDAGADDLIRTGLLSRGTASSYRSWSSRGIPPSLLNIDAALDVDDAVVEGESSRESSSHPSWQSGESSKKSAVDRPAISECQLDAQEGEVERKDCHEDLPVQSHDSTRMDSSILRRGVDDLHISPTSFFAGSERLSGGDDASIGEREEEKSLVRSDVVSLVDADDLIRTGVLSYDTASSYRSWSSRGIPPSLLNVDAALDVEDSVVDGKSSRESASHSSWQSGDSSKKSVVDGSAVSGREVEAMECQVEGSGSRQDVPFVAHDSVRIETLCDRHVVEESHASLTLSFAASTRLGGGDDVSSGKREAVHSSLRSDGKSWVEEDAPDAGRGDLAHSCVPSHDTASSDRSWSSRGVSPSLLNVDAAVDIDDAVENGDSSRECLSRRSVVSGASSQLSAVGRSAVSDRDLPLGDGSSYCSGNSFAESLSLVSHAKSPCGSFDGVHDFSVHNSSPVMTCPTISAEGDDCYVVDSKILSADDSRSYVDCVSLKSWNCNASRDTWTNASFDYDRSISNGSWVSRDSVLVAGCEQHKFTQASNEESVPVDAQIHDEPATMNMRDPGSHCPSSESSHGEGASKRLELSTHEPIGSHHDDSMTQTDATGADARLDDLKSGACKGSEIGLSVDFLATPTPDKESLESSESVSSGSGDEDSYSFSEEAVPSTILSNAGSVISDVSSGVDASRNEGEKFRGDSGARGKLDQNDPHADVVARNLFVVPKRRGASSELLENPAYELDYGDSRFDDLSGKWGARKEKYDALYESNASSGLPMETALAIPPPNSNIVKEVETRKPPKSLFWPVRMFSLNLAARKEPAESEKCASNVMEGSDTVPRDSKERKKNKKRLRYSALATAEIPAFNEPMSTRGDKSGVVPVFVSSTAGEEEKPKGSMTFARRADFMRRCDSVDRNLKFFAGTQGHVSTGESLPEADYQVKENDPENTKNTSQTSLEHTEQVHADEIATREAFPYPPGSGSFPHTQFGHKSRDVPTVAIESEPSQDGERDSAVDFVDAKSEMQSVARDGSAFHPMANLKCHVELDSIASGTEESVNMSLRGSGKPEFLSDVSKVDSTMPARWGLTQGNRGGDLLVGWGEMNDSNSTFGDSEKLGPENDFDGIGANSEDQQSRRWQGDDLLIDASQGFGKIEIDADSDIASELNAENRTSPALLSFEQGGNGRPFLHASGAHEDGVGDMFGRKGIDADSYSVSEIDALTAASPTLLAFEKLGNGRQFLDVDDAHEDDAGDCLGRIEMDVDSDSDSAFEVDVATSTSPALLSFEKFGNEGRFLHAAGAHEDYAGGSFDGKEMDADSYSATELDALSSTSAALLAFDEFGNGCPFVRASTAHEDSVRKYEDVDSVGDNLKSIAATPLKEVWDEMVEGDDSLSNSTVVSIPSSRPSSNNDVGGIRSREIPQGDKDDHKHRYGFFLLGEDTFESQGEGVGVAVVPAAMGKEASQKFDYVAHGSSTCLDQHDDSDRRDPIGTSALYLYSGQQDGGCHDYFPVENKPEPVCESNDTDDDRYALAKTNLPREKLAFDMEDDTIQIDKSSHRTEIESVEIPVIPSDADQLLEIRKTDLPDDTLSTSSKNDTNEGDVVSNFPSGEVEVSFSAVLDDGNESARPEKGMTHDRMNFQTSETESTYEFNANSEYNSMNVGSPQPLRSGHISHYLDSQVPGDLSTEESQRSIESSDNTSSDFPSIGEASTKGQIVESVNALAVMRKSKVTIVDADIFPDPKDLNPASDSETRSRMSSGSESDTYSGSYSSYSVSDCSRSYTTATDSNADSSYSETRSEDSNGDAEYADEENQIPRVREARPPKKAFVPVRSKAGVHRDGGLIGPTPSNLYTLEKVAFLMRSNSKAKTPLLPVDPDIIPDLERGATGDENEDNEGDQRNPTYLNASKYSALSLGMDSFSGGLDLENQGVQSQKMLVCDSRWQGSWKLWTILIVGVVLIVSTVLGVSLAGSKPSTSTQAPISPTVAPTLAFENRAWAQLGDAFLGADLRDQAGFIVALSMDGTTVAVGARRSSAGGLINRGNVKIYRFEFQRWYQIGDLQGINARNQFGFSLSISENGKRLAIGTVGDDTNGSNSGMAEVYEHQGSSWTQIGQFHGRSAGDIFGTSVSISADGRLVAVGAPYSSAAVDRQRSGEVYFFEDIGFNSPRWVESRQKVSGSAGNDYFGWSVSLSSEGDRVAVGAPLDGFRTDPGYVDTFSYTGINGQWARMGQQLGSGEGGDRFGFSVSMDGTGNQLAVGAFRGTNGLGVTTGNARVFRYHDETWDSLGQVLAGESESSNFGYAVSLSAEGDFLAVGAPNQNNSPGTGRANVFTLADSTNWISSMPIKSDIEQSGLGFSVALMSSATRIAVGMPTANEARVYS